MSLLAVSRRAVAAALIAVAVPAALVAHAPAAYADDTGTRAAKRHFEKGEKLFALGKFEDALEQYQKAFDAKPIPALLFNIGQCHRNLGDYEAAIFSFKKYLRLEPDAGNREEVEELIEDLEQKQQRGESKRLRVDRKRATDPDPDEQPESRPVYKKWWFWTTLAVVGGGVAIFVATRDSGAPSTDLGNIEPPP